VSHTLPPTQHFHPGPFQELHLAPDTIHARSDEIEADTHQWAGEHGLIGDNSAAFHAARFPRLAARMFPIGPAEQVSAYARWTVLLLALDDLSEEQPPQPDAIHELYRQIAAALTDPAIPSHTPLVRAVQDQWRQLPARMSPAWRERFVRHLVRHGQALVWEARLRGTRTTPSPAAFMDLRPWANGMFMWDLIETVHAHEAPAPAIRTLAWRFLTSSSNQIIAWRNDLCSLSREAAIDNHSNYVIVLAHALGCDFETAAQLVEEQIGRRVQELLAYERALNQQDLGLNGTERRALTDITTTLRTMTAAHARWVIESGRYPQGVSEACPGSVRGVEAAEADVMSA
jgi:hypothetical protein